VTKSDDTVAVMGGEDWEMWIDALDAARPRAHHGVHVRRREDHLGHLLKHDRRGQAGPRSARARNREKLARTGGDARVSVLKAVVTQASSAIPVMPLYLSLLFKVMKEQGTHEGCIEQVDALFRDSLYGENPILDAEGRLRADGHEMRPEVQNAVTELWSRVSTENLGELADFPAYKSEFLRLFGFGVDGVDYGADVDPVVPMPGLVPL
jgi:enoyl-[acyl-carrier protein] reductase/trans-2-enoyl-CoA reductase (NAD+)